ncbi:MAG: hemolysin family protein [Verrucomicrobiales bacterium]|nr:hemolysin family protein [Verrucomicrobiales bacterium]
MMGWILWQGDFALFDLPSLLAMAGSEQMAHEWTLGWGDMSLRLLLVLFFILLNGFFVAAEFALVKVRASQLDTMIDEGKKGARLARHMTDGENLDAYLSACQLGITLASLALGWIGEPFVGKLVQPLLFKMGIADQWVTWVSFFLAFSFITFMHVVVGEQMPKSLAIRKSAPTSLWVVRPLALFYRVFILPIWLLNVSAKWLMRTLFRIDVVPAHELVHSAEEIRILVAETEKADDVTDTEREILINALALNDLSVRDIMTPRNEVVTLDVEKSFEENLKVALETKHTRFPLVKEGHLDHVVGLIHIKDLLGQVRESDPDLLAIKREIFPVPELMKLDVLLKTFLAKHAHLALVVDEFGGALGLVMLDDVVEQLVGEIQDEFDEEDVEFRRLNDDEFVVHGTYPLHELGVQTDLDLENPDVSTVGGYVTHLAGRLPEKGEQIRVENYQALITDADERSVREVQFTRVFEELKEGGEGEGKSAAAG